MSQWEIFYSFLSSTYNTIVVVAVVNSREIIDCLYFPLKFIARLVRLSHNNTKNSELIKILYIFLTNNTLSMRDVEDNKILLQNKHFCLQLGTKPVIDERRSDVDRFRHWKLQKNTTNKMKIMK